MLPSTMYKKYSITKFVPVLQGLFTDGPIFFLCVCFLFPWCPSMYLSYSSPKIEAPPDKARSVSQPGLKEGNIKAKGDN